MRLFLCCVCGLLFCLPEAAAARQLPVHELNYFQAYETQVDGQDAWRIEIGINRPDVAYTLREKTFLRKANTKKVINASTTMVAIALGARENVDETLAPDEDEVWRDYCERLANAALEFNEHATAVAAGKGSFDDMKAAHKAVEETCSSTCHEKFGGQTAE